MLGELVYLDNAAATRLDERVLEAMKPYMFETYAVATSQFGYSPGIEAKDALDHARSKVAAALGATAEEIVVVQRGGFDRHLHPAGRDDRFRITLLEQNIVDAPVLADHRCAHRCLPQTGRGIVVGIAETMFGDRLRTS